MDKELKTKLIQLGLFIATVFTATWTGAEMMYGRSMWSEPNGLSWSEFWDGLTYSIPFLLILTAHEFGHYFTALKNNVKVSLPYYIPMPITMIGTMGAFIRIKDKIKSNKVTFDVGIAGPLAGFVLALFVLYFGFTNLPDREHIFEIHPEYEMFGLDYENHVYEKDTFFLVSEFAKINPEAAAVYDIDTVWLGPSHQMSMVMGSNMIMDFFKSTIVSKEDQHKIPNPYEIMHYPLLLGGFWALFFTSLNLLPIGQLDGGHVLYGLVGNKRHRIISPIIYMLFLGFAGLGTGFMGFFNPFDFSQDSSSLIIALLAYALLIYYLLEKIEGTRQTKLMYTMIIIAVQYLIIVIWPHAEGYPSWFFFAFLIGRFLGVYHPPSEIEEPLSLNRQILGWLALVIFLLCASPKPIMIV